MEWTPWSLAKRRARQVGAMESLYLLLPLSLVFVALIGGVLWWSIFAGQYDDPDGAGRSILSDDDKTAVEQPKPDVSQPASSQRR